MDHWQIVRLLLSHPKLELTKKEIAVARSKGFDLVKMQQEMPFHNEPVPIRKHVRDSLGGVVACKIVLHLAAPSFTAQVVANEELLSSLSNEEKEVLQLIVDYLLYDPSVVIEESRCVVIALFLVGRFKGEAVPLKKQLMAQLVENISLAKVLDVLQLIEEYLLRSKSFIEENGSLSAVREYCLDLIATSADSTDYEQHVENDPRLDSYLRTLMKRKTMRSLLCDECPLSPKLLSEAFDSALYSDVRLDIAGQAVRSHKSVLASKSEYFRTLFDSGHWSCEETYPEEYLYLVKYCYGILDKDIPSDLNGPLIDLAHMHEMHSFMQIISDRIVITADNFESFSKVLLPYRSGESLSVGLASIKEKLSHFVIGNHVFIENNLAIIPECIKDDIIIHSIRNK